MADRTWEIERDRFSHMCNPALEVGECVTVVEESRLREARLALTVAETFIPAARIDKYRERARAVLRDDG